MTRTLLFAVLLLLAACGFEPVHGRARLAQQQTDLSAVRIEVDNTRLGQLLKAEIERGVNPDYERAEKLYTLKINLTERDVYLFINPDGTATRGDVEFLSSYNLTRRIDGKSVSSGELNRTAAYNISETADYATYVSEEDARKRGVTELAQDYKLRLSNLMMRLNPRATQ